MRKFLVVLVLTLLSACGQLADVYNVENEPVVTGTGKVPTLEEVSIAIRKGVTAKTWRVQNVSENQIIAHYTKGTRIVRVKIDFSPQQYSITYSSSERMRYDGTNINRRYNSWIRGLRKEINSALLYL